VLMLVEFVFNVWGRELVCRSDSYLTDGYLYCQYPMKGIYPAIRRFGLS